MRPRLPARRSATTAIIVAATTAAVAIGASVIAQSGEDTTPDPPPGTPVGRQAEVGAAEMVNTGGDEYDPTILTKFIPGHAFIDYQGTDPHDDASLRLTTGSCVGANSAAGTAAGNVLNMFAGVELPDGARIKQITFFGENSDATHSIRVELVKTTVNVPQTAGPPVTAVNGVVDSFTVATDSGVVAISGVDDLMERAGSRTLSPADGTDHFFHSIRVRMRNSADLDHQLCGVEVAYQVPAGGQDDVIQFTALDEPIRAFDSRQTGGGGLLAPNDVRTVSVTDALNPDGTLNTADVVPADATAVTYNITIAGPTGRNFASVTPASASGLVASAVNFNGTANVANAGTVSITSGDIKVWAGGQVGSFQFIIDVTGYYSPKEIELPNMGN